MINNIKEEWARIMKEKYSKGAFLSFNALLSFIQNTKYKEPAWKELLKRGVSNERLCYLIYYTDYKDKAAKQLLKQNPTTDDLRFLAHYTKYKEQAAELVLKQKHSINDLSWVLTLDTKHRENAIKQYLKKQPNDKDLLFLIGFLEHLNCPNLNKYKDQAEQIIILNKGSEK